MIAKKVLPVLGGSPAVWTTCLVFFQAALLAGYVFAHATTHWLGVRRQTLLQCVLVVLPLFLMPLGLLTGPIVSPPDSAQPTLWLLRLLTQSVGFSFVMVATTGPLLQRWFSVTHHAGAENPYYLYGASNLGSMVALLGYPIVIEPYFGLSRQLGFWQASYYIFVVITFACALITWTSRSAPQADSPPDAQNAPTDRPARARRLRWVAHAFVPSSYLMGVTTCLSTDIAAVPLLWIIPLSLYLLSFIIAFARRPVLPHTAAMRLLPFAVMALAPAMAAGLVQPFWIPLHLLTFFLAALVCHGDLAADRPAPAHLTSFYLAIALGGALGGVFNALIAPLIFDRIAEYPLAMVLACLFLPRALSAARSIRSVQADLLAPLFILFLVAPLVRNTWGLSESVIGAFLIMLAAGLVLYIFWTHRTHPIRFALCVGTVLLASGLSPGVDGIPLLRERNFFGVLRVTAVERENIHRLFHGNTLHGQQCLEPARRREPLTYFTRSGPIGQVFEAIHEQQKQSVTEIAIVGLGTGTLACYAEPDERWTFLEIDPDVARIAQNPRYFTYLADSRAGSTGFVTGDARLRLRDAQAHEFRLIVLDAFSSDSLPVHLITREALRLYTDKLAPGGLIVFNLSNRFLDLEPVVASLARDANLVCRLRADVDISPEEKKQGKQASIWAVMAAREADLGSLAADPRWKAARMPAQADVWTDDYSNIIGHIRFMKPRS